MLLHTYRAPTSGPLCCSSVPVCLGGHHHVSQPVRYFPVQVHSHDGHLREHGLHLPTEACRSGHGPLLCEPWSLTLLADECPSTIFRSPLVSMTDVIAREPPAVSHLNSSGGQLCLSFVSRQWAGAGRQ